MKPEAADVLKELFQSECEEVLWDRPEGRCSSPEQPEELAAVLNRASAGAAWLSASALPLPPPGHTVGFEPPNFTPLGSHEKKRTKKKGEKRWKEK